MKTDFLDGQGHGYALAEVSGNPEAQEFNRWALRTEILPIQPR